MDVADPSLERWQRNTPLLGLDDERLRFRARCLLQQRAGEAQRLCAILNYVQSIAFELPSSPAVSARQVMDGFGNGWFGKTTLFVALMRGAGFPARARLLQFSPTLLHGLIRTAKPFSLPVAEVFSGGRWVRTDLHIYDKEYFRLARHALAAHGWSEGFGIHQHGARAWDGKSDALAMAPRSDTADLADLGPFDDAAGFFPQVLKHDTTWPAHHTEFVFRKQLISHGLRRLRRGAFAH